MRSAKNFLEAIGVQNFTPRHLKIVDEFLQSNETDCRVVLNKLGTWSDEILTKATQFMNNTRYLTKTEEIKLMIIENFIDYFTTDEKERESMKNEAYTYVIEDHIDEISLAGFKITK